MEQELADLTSPGWRGSKRKPFDAIYAILSTAEIELPEFPVECVCTSPSSDFSRFIVNRSRP